MSVKVCNGALMHKLVELCHDSFQADHPVSWDGNQVTTWAQFMADVSATTANFDDIESNDCALFHSHTYTFSVALLALLSKGKKVFLPGENHAGITTKLRSADMELVGDFADVPCRQIQLSNSPCSQPFKLKGTVVIFTSGSTGNAKPIPKTLTQLDNEIQALESSWGAQICGANIASTVSHQHFYGFLFSLLWPLCAGRPFYCKQFVDPTIMADTMNRLGDSAWVMSPAHLHRLSDSMPWAASQEKVKIIFSSGGPLQQEAALLVQKELGKAPVEIFGSSETGAIAARQQARPESNWVPLKSVEIRLNENGLLVVHSPWLEDDDWYVTADLVTMTPQGEFVLKGRADRIIKLEGKRVALPGVESTLTAHPWITEATALIVHRKRTSLGAVLVLSDTGATELSKSGKAFITREFRSYLSNHLSAAAIPRLWRIVTTLPRNTQGKIITAKLQALFQQSNLPKILHHEAVDSRISLVLRVDADLPYFEGHFPDSPILPGVTQLFWAQQFGNKFFPIKGNFSGLKTVKFRDVVFPNQELTLVLEYTAEPERLTFHYDSIKGRHSQGSLLFEVNNE